ncbi:carboxypeptidase regulatory-like domain-containing protein [Halobaculum halobium]|uniref:Carboxypeptidase regulatory-like domain-containing protein n=1 Tax=Halobaculum halobium TaxID=3032281 RepID=A0ABD5TDD1_9EURY
MEGLPVRLVIALVVGVACLSVMLNMVSGVEGLAVSELDVRPSPEVTTPGEQDLALTVVDPEGQPVSGATVVVSGDTARLDGVATARTGTNGTATVTVEPTLGPNREQGTLTVSIKPPADGQYADRRGNTRVLVVAE